LLDNPLLKERLSLDSPHDIVPWKTAQSVPGGAYRAGARSVALLYGDAAMGAI
jgi:hypothetical protein